MPWRAKLAVASVGAWALLVLSVGTASAADGLRAMNAVPPGESGMTTLSAFSLATSGGSPTYGPHTDDQRELYASWQYKPMQFVGAGQGSSPPGDPNVKIVRDAQYGVPTITGVTDGDAFYGVGYAMAADRLFQMDVFRHVGHGTLAELIGAGGLTMDEAVRRVTEGDAALQKEFDALPADARDRLQRFTDGINAYIDQAQTDPSLMPAEFVLLNDLPLKHWTVLDVLGFGEYAGRFFGEFGHGELGAATAYEHLVARYGQRKAERIFHDMLPLNDPRAPTSIARRDGLFKRHVKGRVKTSFHGSPYANHNPAVLPDVAQLAPTAAAVAARQARVTELQRTLALPRFGSNSVIVSSRLAKNHKPMLYGGPQTGWAVPGFFWEVELHSPARDQRGVMVPAIPLIVIGRNAHAAWTVTSALDANSDTFVEQLDPSNSTYRHNGQTMTVQKHQVTIHCNNPPTTATPLLAGQTPTPCPAQDRTLNVYRTVHGPAIADPDTGHHLYTRQSVVDGRLLKSLTTWDTVGRQSTVGGFGSTLSGMSLGFNFLYAGDDGHTGYWHTGAYPIRPANADPTLPLPGDGRYDWRGLESWKAHPHVIDPKSGYLVNWNNKPSVGWWSKNLGTGGEGGIWGHHWESEPLAKAVRRRVPLTFNSLGQVPRDVAYIDNPARVFLPSLRKALRKTKAPQLVTMRGFLRKWNGRRDVVDGNGHYGTPAVVFFDRFVEKLMRDTQQPVLGADWAANSGLDCLTCHLRSVDNLGSPTYKFEIAGLQLVSAALKRQTRYRWVRKPKALFLRAAGDAAAELTAEQGADPSKWNEPVDTGEFSAQGAISVKPLVPLPNRGSYGQVIEAAPAP
ncbi:MAG: penicillin amidase [Thermoleophilaceae bacterium]|nr:penicillin amidase [Thermoleophilaceae bacterium]